MSNYIFIETRDPFTSADTRFVADVAVALKQNGHNVTIFLVQNGVLALRKEAKISALRHLAEAGITLLADDFSLRERGIFQINCRPVFSRRALKRWLICWLQKTQKPFGIKKEKEQ